MKIRIPPINARNIKTQIIAARCLGNLNFVFKKVKIGNSKTANKNANRTGVRMSLVIQKI